MPWYIGDGQRIRAATGADVATGWAYLQRLLGLLLHLRVIVLVGRKAQQIHSRLAAERPDLTIIDCPHPSPLFINRRAENRGLVLDALWQAAAILNAPNGANPMSEKLPKAETTFLDRLIDWKLDDLVIEEESPQPEQPGDATGD